MKHTNSVSDTRSRESDILLVVDIRGWAFSFVAKYIQSSLGKKSTYIIYTEDFRSYREFCNYLESIDYSCLFFFSRKYLFELINYIALFRKSSIPIILDHCILTTVPDHAYSTKANLKQYVTHFSVVDGYVTTSKRLFEYYRSFPEQPPPYGVIHDHPHLEFNPGSRKPHHANSKTIRICWVGNSTWGTQYGLVDYKGLNTIILPAITRLEDEYDIEFSVYDSSIKTHPKQIIDQALLDADIFLCASVQEGTPLPVVEAMAYGCAIVSTDVGVVPDIFTEQQQKFITQRDPGAFYSAIKTLCDDSDLLSAISNANVEQYNLLYAKENGHAWQSFFSDMENQSSSPERKIEKQALMKELTDALPLSARLCLISPQLKKSTLLRRLAAIYHQFRSII